LVSFSFIWGYTQSGSWAGVSLDPPPDSSQLLGCFEAGYMHYDVTYNTTPPQLKVTVSTNVYPFLRAVLQDAYGNIIGVIDSNPFTLTADVINRLDRGLVFIYVQTNTIVVNIQQPNNGSISPQPGRYIIRRGMPVAWVCERDSVVMTPYRDKITIQATPNQGYVFSYFIVGDQVVYDNPYTIDPPCKDMTLNVQAVFTQQGSPPPSPSPTPTQPTTLSAGYGVLFTIVLGGVLLLYYVRSRLHY
jgi:hypothetical protein